MRPRSNMWLECWRIHFFLSPLVQKLRYFSPPSFSSSSLCGFTLKLFGAEWGGGRGVRVENLAAAVVLGERMTTLQFITPG